MISIPKRKTYRPQAILFFVCAGISFVLVAVGAITTQALTVPSLTDDSREQRNQSSERKNNPKDDKKRDADIPATNTDREAKKQQTQPLTPIARQSSQPQQRLQPKTVAVSKQTTSASTISQTPVKTDQPVIDTSAASIQLASSQSAQVVSPVVYESSKIPLSLRDTLYQASIVSMASGLVIYLASYARTALRWVSRTSAYSPRIITE